MLEIIRAAYVIGRRDFTAIIFSKAFLLFLLGPLFPVIVGGFAGALGGQVAADISKPAIGIAMSAADNQKLLDAQKSLSKDLGEYRFPELKMVAIATNTDAYKALLKDKKNGLVAVFAGCLDAPTIVGTYGQVENWRGEMALLTSYAKNSQNMPLPSIKAEYVAKSAGNSKQLQQVTAQAAVVLLFMLTMLLAGMVLSNLVEEKSNKIIEILAAAVPIDAVFLGKLFAMLAMATVGICVWASVGMGLISLAGSAVPALPAPAVGWPIFFILGVIYFAMAYLILGSLFLGVGAMAATVREVQTLSMPATMSQLLVFFLAMFSITKINQPIETFAAIFPFSSPFVMMARAAQDATLWHHGVAIVGQALFVILVLRVGVYFFRRNVMKSGNAGRVKDNGAGRKLFGIIPMGRAA